MEKPYYESFRTEDDRWSVYCNNKLIRTFDYEDEAWDFINQQDYEWEQTHGGE